MSSVSRGLPTHSGQVGKRPKRCKHFNKSVGRKQCYERQFLSTLEKFQAQRSPNQMKRWPVNVEKFQAQRSPNQMKRWPVNVDNKDHPYILDWYYISHHLHHRPHDIETGFVDVEYEDEAVMNTRIPPDLGSNWDQLDDNWRTSFEDRTNSNLEASASRTIIHHLDFRNLGQATRSHWWIRKGWSPVVRTGVGPAGSFLEPPNFHRNSYYDHYDNLSGKSFQEHDPQWGWG
ncbi:hypothetical protein Hanom_Chr04g00346371 [Helianthus anomalus]